MDWEEFNTLEELLFNEARNARLQYDNTKDPEQLGRYKALYELYQVYCAKTGRENRLITLR